MGAFENASADRADRESNRLSHFISPSRKTESFPSYYVTHLVHR